MGGSPACVDGDTPPKGSSLKMGSSDTVLMGLKVYSVWGSWEMGSWEASGS